MMRFVICSKSTSPLLILIDLLSLKAGSHYSLLYKKTFNSKTLQPINGTVRLHNNTLVTVPVFDTKHMIISLLTDPSEINEKNFGKYYDKADELGNEEEDEDYIEAGTKYMKDTRVK